MVGIGFGTGLSHARVPRGITEAAEGAGLPVLEVPLETPFIAVTKAVWTALTADEHDLQEKAYRAQLELTRAANGPDGPARLLAVLARELECLGDARGRRQGCWFMPRPQKRATHLEAVRAQSRQLRESGNRGIVIGTVGDDEVVVQALRDGDRGTSLLAIGRRTTLSPVDRNVVNTATSLLAVAAHQTTASAAADARIREALLRLLAGGYLDAAYHLAEQLDVTFPAEPAMLVVVLGPGRQLAALARAVDSAATGRGEPVLLDADRHGRLVLMLTSGGYLHRQLPSLIHRFPGTAAGTAAMTSLGDLPRALRDADNAVRAGRRRGAALTDVADIGQASLLAMVTSSEGRVVRGVAAAPAFAARRGGPW